MGRAGGADRAVAAIGAAIGAEVPLELRGRTIFPVCPTAGAAASAAGAPCQPSPPDAGRSDGTCQNRSVQRLPTASLLCLLLASASAAGATEPSLTLDPQAVGRFAELALACVHREYPNHISHDLRSDADVRPPRELSPAFHGCLDWHSSVHGHWLLARAARLYPGEPFAERARAALGQSFTAENVAGEVAYLKAEGRASFERPYGLAWLLQLAAELRSWDDPDARRWSAVLAPLEEQAAARIASWLPKLRYPIRTGEHGQTAFAFGLILDWADRKQDAAMHELVAGKARQFYLADRACPLEYEPSGEDFLSLCIAEADLMRRVLDRAAFARWLTPFLPSLATSRGKAAWLTPAIVTDRSDPRLAHIDGLNLSRAWMLEGVASGLPPSERRVGLLRATAAAHRAAALPAVTGEHYAGGHWLGTYALYLVTGGRIAAPADAPVSAR